MTYRNLPKTREEALEQVLPNGGSLDRGRIAATGDYSRSADIEGGASGGLAPQALFGSAPIVSTNVAPFAMSA